MNLREKKIERMQKELLENPFALVEMEIYAQQVFGDQSFFYKVLILFHDGFLKLDTTNVQFLTKTQGKRLIKWENLTRCTSSELFKNWQKHGIWESREFETKLTQAWDLVARPSVIRDFSFHSDQECT